MLSKRPEERLTASEALQHDWMKNMGPNTSKGTNGSEETKKEDGGKEELLTINELEQKLKAIHATNEQLKAQLVQGELMAAKIQNIIVQKKKTEKE